MVSPNAAFPGINFFDCTVQECLAYFREEFQNKAFRAASLFRWVYTKGVLDIRDMTDLSKQAREELGGKLTFELPEITRVLHSADGSYKFIQRMLNGDEIETVAMKHDDHFSVCVSSQVGCAMGCRFCNTGKMGLRRNLQAGEIVGQVYNVHTFLLRNHEKPLRNIVYMGMGEPFHNYANVTKSLHILMDQNGFHFGNRRITVSTSGLVPQIERFIKEEKANLAISLNAVENLKRQQLMPISVKYPLEKLIQTCRDNSFMLKKRITFEYIMMKGVNDSLMEAKLLAKLLRGIKAKINLIPYNMNSGLGFERSDESALKAFQQSLLDQGYVATVRYSKGQDIAAACGQLISEKKKDELRV